MSDDHPLDAENGIQCDGCREIHYALVRHTDEKHAGAHVIIVSITNLRRGIIIVASIGLLLGIWLAKDV